MVSQIVRLGVKDVFTQIANDVVGQGLDHGTFVRLNNNSLSGICPGSLSKIEGLTLVDISYNNLSGSLPKVSARTFKVIGNTLICGPKAVANCSAVFPKPLTLPQDDPSDESGTRTNGHHLAVAFAASFSAAFLVIFTSGMFLWWRYRRNKQIFFDVNEQYDPEVSLGHLKRYTFKELRSATNHFNSKNILGRGGYGIVYKGHLSDGSLVAVKRLKDWNIAGGEVQFQTEGETISLALHRNLLRLRGFCSSNNERILVYPYMPNGSVASRLKDHIRGEPALDWSRRKKIAVVVGDFRLARLLDHRDSHVTTAVRGTVGHIAPEYLSTGQSSEKTDVFGFGILLLELITGQKALDFGRSSHQKGVMLDWVSFFTLFLASLPRILEVKKLHQEGKLKQLIDKDLNDKYDRVELEEIVQVALLCTQFNPSNRPKMSEVMKMLKGDGLAERWESSQNGGAASLPPPLPSGVVISSPRMRYYSDYIEESSLVVEAIELSGPR
ncbi:hypothetical protein YC2023_051260 [Brassica napus]